MASDTHFKIIVPMYNCETLAIKCIDSILNQQYSNWHLIICIEPSDDNTFNVVVDYLIKLNDKRISLIKNDVRKGVPRNHKDCIRASCPNNDDVIILVDGDDCLHGTDVFSYLDKVYRNDFIWITWGSYKFDHCDKKGLAAVREPVNDPHRGKRWWRYSHLKTFRFFLFKGIEDKDLRDETTGEYYTVAGDMALMFPMIEMAGPDHSKYIDKILYVYNQSTPFNDEKIYYPLCKKCDLEIRNKKRYSVRTKNELISLD